MTKITCQQRGEIPNKAGVGPGNMRQLDFGRIRRQNQIKNTTNELPVVSY